MTKRFAALALAFCVFISGCVYSRTMIPEGYAVVYCVNTEAAAGESLLRRQQIRVGSDMTETECILSALNSNSNELVQAGKLPYGVRIEACSIKDGVARIEVAEEYSRLEPLERLLADSAITLSFMTIDSVCSVDIYCGDECLAEGLSIEYIAEADSLAGDFERTVKLFVPDYDGRCLVPRSHSVRSDSGSTREELILRELLSQLRGDARPVEIMGMSLSEGVCSIDLSAEFYGIEPADAMSGRLLLQSIVMSLCRLPGIESVSISVDGNALDSFGGGRVSWPMSPDEELVSYQ